MLFSNLPQSMSAQQFADLQQGNRYAPERPIETEHMSLRQMLQKREREISEATRCELPNQRSEMNGNCQEIEDGGNKDSDEHKPSIINTAPTWLSNAMLQQAHNAAGASASSTNSYSQWLSMPINAMHHTEGSNPNPDMVENVTISAQQSHGSSGQGKGFLDLHADTANSSDLVDGEAAETDDHNIWQNAKLKAEIVSHPLYEQLLAAHVACLRTATPVDQLSKIDAQLGHSHQVASKYAILNNDQNLLSKDKEELNEFMAHYVTLLRSFKDQLQQHVRVHAMEAVVACWELEQSLMSLTGVSPGEGTGATMSDEEDEHSDSDPGYFDCMDGHDASGFGPLIPTETERTLMERVRHELKLELKQGYRARINDVREEILRKRRAGKLPGDTTSVLKSWWHAHSKWPYPSEDEKARLVQETGLELKQINNWFINQRKRNWHSNPSSSASLKNKRKN